jgi:hypothetical protein
MAVFLKKNGAARPIQLHSDRGFALNREMDSAQLTATVTAVVAVVVPLVPVTVTI